MIGSALDCDEFNNALSLPTVTQSSHGFAAGDVVRNSAADTYTKAQADSEANIGVGLSIVLASIDSNNFAYAPSGKHGDVTISSHGFGGFGTNLWLSQGTAGLITATQPTSGLIVYLGYVVDANTIRWEPGLRAYEV